MEHIRDHQKPARPVKVIQFGGGVFLRGFFDWMLQKANNAGVYNGNAVIVRSRTSGKDPLAEQNFNYTHLARDGAHVDVTLVDSIACSVDAAGDCEAFLALARNPDLEVVVSNTTEAGITYENCTRQGGKCPKTYPAKLTELLYARYGAGLGGLLVLPCELIEQNGDKLREYVLRHAADWGLEQAFADWVRTQCDFRNTLVDRIVSGKPDGPVKLPYADEMVNCSEYFHLFVIEGKPDSRLPFDRAGANIKWVRSVEDYRTVKVRILNGAHTSMIPYAMLCGVETVGECLQDERTADHLRACLAEILCSMEGDAAENRAYADAVLERFANPYIRHLCKAISLNSVSKFKVRVLPSILAYKQKTKKSPAQLLFALAMLVKFYKEGTPTDDEAVIERFRSASVAELLSDAALWGVSLAEYVAEVEQYANSPL